MSKKVFFSFENIAEVVYTCPHPTSSSVSVLTPIFDHSARHLIGVTQDYFPKVLYVFSKSLDYSSKN